MNTTQNPTQHKNEQGKQNLKQQESHIKQAAGKPNEKVQSPTQRNK